MTKMQRLGLVALLFVFAAACADRSPIPTGIRTGATSSDVQVSGSPGPGPTAPVRPGLAPPGSVLFTSDGQSATSPWNPDYTISALLPDGATTVVATLPGLNNGVPNRPDLYPPTALLCPVLVSATFFVAVPFASIDNEGLSRVKVFDLLRPGTPPVAELETPTDPCEYRWGPGGRLALDRYNEGLRAVLDTATGETHDIRIAPDVQVLRQLWTTDGESWQAYDIQDDSATIGTVSATTGEYVILRELPPAWVYGGGQPLSADGHVFRSTGADASAVAAPSPSCDQVVTSSIDQTDESSRQVWWDSCRDGGRIWYRQWDIDGRGLLTLVERDGRWTFERWDRPGEREVLASVRLPAMDQLVVHAVAPGPGPDQIQIVFHTLGKGGAALHVLRSGEDRVLTISGPGDNVDGFSGVVPVE